MNFAAAARTYSNVGLETAVGSADPLGLVLMLYDGAIMAVNKAQAALRERNLRVKGESISKAIQIIEEGLRASLDRKAGGDIAKQLDSLYEYMCQKLLMASVANDLAPMAEIAKLLTDLRETWAALVKRPGQPASAMQPAVQASSKPLHAVVQAAAQPAAQPAAAQPAAQPQAVAQPQAAVRNPMLKQAAAAYAAPRF